jgi:ribonuclease HII
MLRVERELQASGCLRVAGIDEVGRGPLAGPVCAAVVIFPPGTRIAGVDDSKKLNHEIREELNDRICSAAECHAVGFATAEEIDRINILQATKLAMRRALAALPSTPDFLLLDALTLEHCAISQRGIIQGDGKCFSIAAASIVAKVARDRLMDRYHAEFPQYAFDQHKGYATELHWARILEHGICSLHRRTFFDPGFLGPAMKMSAEYQKLSDQLLSADCKETLEQALARLDPQRDFLPLREIEDLRALAARRATELNPTQLSAL